MPKAKSKASVSTKPADAERLVVKVYVNEKEHRLIRLAAAFVGHNLTEYCRKTLVEQAKLAKKKIAELESD